MIFRGLLRLAVGQKSGMAEFGSSLDGFTASLAPLIAFPLVGAVTYVLDGQWQLAVIGFLSRLCAVLVVPLLTYEFARRWGREGMWLRTATALNWTFWAVIPAIMVAALAAAVMAQAGLAMMQVKAAGIGMILGYTLRLHWFVARIGLEISAGRAVVFVVVTSLAIGVLTAGPLMINDLFIGTAVFS